MKKIPKLVDLKKLVLFLAFIPSFVFAQSKFKVSSVAAFQQSLNSNTGLKTSGHQLQTPDGNLNVKFNVNANGNYIGSVANTKTGVVYITSSGQSISGKVVLPEQDLAYEYITVNGEVFLEKKNINEVLCVHFDDHEDEELHSSHGAPKNTKIAGLVSTDLQSLPGATAVILLDFNGETVSGTLWNGGNTIVAAPATQNESERIEIWKMVSEDFRPFNLNITTIESVYQAAPANRRMRCIFTPTKTAAPTAGGVAYLNSFTWGNNTPCWVFNGGIKGGGEAGSHEIGHTLGLAHDGRVTPAEGYFQGHGNWAPIMGVGYYRNIVQWSKGEYNSANNTEDDIAKISGSGNGFGFRADDYGNTTATATALTISGTGAVTTKEGLISQRTDVDVFSFATGGGNVSLTVTSSAAYINLDILSEIRNASGVVVASANSTTTMNATLTANLAAGNYYLYVDGTGAGNPSTDGYSDYASLGTYSITGTIPPVVGNPAPAVTLTAPSNGASFTAPAAITLTATATDANGTVIKVDFYNGTTLLGSDATAPYSLTLSNVAAGTYSYKAIATDNENATGTSATSTVTVSNVTNTPPVATLTAPANGASFTAPATITLTATATDANGTVTKVDFYNGATLLGSDATSPYSLTLSNVAAGTYSYRAIATDNGNATGTSATSTVTVTSVNTTVGINGPACVTPGVSYQFTLNPDAGFTSASWWINGTATITVDPSDSKKITLVVATGSTGTLTLNAGANFNTTPWYKQYTKSITLGSCAPAGALLVSPEPAQESSILKLEDADDKIIFIQVFDRTGREIQKLENINTNTTELGQNLAIGIYTIRVVTEKTFYVRNFIKQ